MFDGGGILPCERVAVSSSSSSSPRCSVRSAPLPRGCEARARAKPLCRRASF